MTLKTLKLRALFSTRATLSRCLDQAIQTRTKHLPPWLNNDILVS